MIDSLIVGGGPAGLSAARELSRSGASVVVVDRAPDMGGVPNDCHHVGFGIRDLHRILSGPAYARRLAEDAAAVGAVLLPYTTVTGVGADGVSVVSPRGAEILSARTIVLATGCRERPRAARLVAGDRPAGVLTTGSLQRLVGLRAGPVGTSAVVVGAEHVSLSAVRTLVSAGCRVVAVVCESHGHATWPGALAALAARYRFDVHLGHRVRSVNGRGRVASVDIERAGDATGEAVHRLRCDTVVFTGGWVPEHELARAMGCRLSPGWRGPAVDDTGATSLTGVFAAGNLLHGALTADLCALEGRRVAASVVRQLESPSSEVSPALDVFVEPPLGWVHPTRVRQGVALVVGAGAEAVGRGRIVVRQGGRVLVKSPPVQVVPGRTIRLAGRWWVAPDPAGPSLAVTLCV